LTICSANAAQNELSKKEKRGGWKLLFNGKDANEWRRYRQPDLGDKWIVQNGTLHLSGKGGGNLVTKQQYSNFEFSIDWKISEGGNSGIFWHCTEGNHKIYKKAMEMQILDNATGAKPKHLAGSLYDMLPVDASIAKPAGQWNTARIMVEGPRVRLWLNGTQTADVSIGSESWQTLLNNSKFKTWEGFGLNEKGHIGLQDHGNPVWFRNIKIREINMPEAAWYDKTDFGTALATHVNFGKSTLLKGLVVQVGENKNYSLAYDTATMKMVAGWEGFLDLRGATWDGRQMALSTPAGGPWWTNEFGPGWASPRGDYEDPRTNGWGPLPRAWGPLPRAWLKYKGLYRNGNVTVLKYTVGETEVLESPSLEKANGVRAFARTLRVSPGKQTLQMWLLDGGNTTVTAALVGNVPGCRLSESEDGATLLEIAPRGEAVTMKVLVSQDTQIQEKADNWPPAEDLLVHLNGGAARWPQEIAVTGTKGADSGPYATDLIPLPVENPWHSRIRFGGFDFFADGKRAALCTWNGDVWIVSGIDDDLQNLKWRRYAAGLFETLGVRIVDDVVYVTGKDQITRLHDLNNDGEADYYECFNNDVKITSNFHEFTFDLQTDTQGNFYFAKGAPVKKGGRGFGATNDHHGAVLKVSKDGKHSEIWGSGLRAPGGVGVGPNGEVTTGENEGTYVPACKINWVSKDSFSGVVHSGNGRTFEQGYDKPLCWLPMQVDNSGGGQVWVDNDQWGPFKGELLHLSYGRSAVFKVMRQDVNGTMQGGVVQLPIKLSSAAMRGRFNPVDKQLYVVGFRGWQTNAATECAFQRVRHTGKPVFAPTELKATKKGIYLTFSSTLDKELAEDVGSYTVKWWQYVWGPQYGSAHFSISNPDDSAMAMALEKESKSGGTRGGNVAAAAFKGDSVTVKSATLQADGKTVFLEIPEIRENVMQMQIDFDVETVDGDLIVNSIYNTIHELSD
jgi:hypothetical protein